MPIRLQDSSEFAKLANEEQEAILDQLSAAAAAYDTARGALKFAEAMKDASADTVKEMLKRFHADFFVSGKYLARVHVTEKNTLDVQALKAALPDTYLKYSKPSSTTSIEVQVNRMAEAKAATRRLGKAAE